MALIVYSEVDSNNEIIPESPIQFRGMGTFYNRHCVLTSIQCAKDIKENIKSHSVVNMPVTGSASIPVKKAAYTKESGKDLPRGFGIIHVSNTILIRRITLPEILSDENVSRQKYEYFSSIYNVIWCNLLN